MKHLLLILSLVVGTMASAQYTKLLDLGGGTNGTYPQDNLISDGTFLYGMTLYGGTYDKGTIFKIKPDGSGYAKILDFEGTSNGSNPRGSLYFDGTYLYGMTQNGGANNLGTIFKILPDGTGFAKLFDFGIQTGVYPFGSLISDGTNLYGMTIQGGANDMGTIFKLLPNGTEFTKLLDFSGAENGAYPYGSLFFDGTFLYGMAEGGTNNQGTIFKLKPDGSEFTKLYDFAGAANGLWPRGDLISDGTYLYGMARFGGTQNMGTIFKLLPDGSDFTKLHDFAVAANGKNPYGTLVLEGAFLYGMTYSGGISNFGTIFKIKPDGGDYMKLFDFTGGLVGEYTYGSPVSDGNNLYGMTYGGGANERGVVFKYSLCTPATSTDIVTACKSYTWIDGNTYTSDNNTATYVISGGSSSGCDSLVTLNLTINTANTAVSQSSNVLTASAGNASYRWLDCDNGFAVIPGEVSQTYTATVNGNYAVEVTQNSCTDTSSCYAVTSLGLHSIDGDNSIQLNPNPYSVQTVIHSDQMLQNATLTMINYLGQTVRVVRNLSGHTFILSRENLANGMYLIQLTQDNQVIATKKLIVRD